MPTRLPLLVLLILAGLANLGWSQLDLPRHTKPKVKPSKGVELPAPKRTSLLEEAFGNAQEGNQVEQASGAEGENPERPASVLDLPSMGLRPSAPVEPLALDPETPGAQASEVFEKLVRKSLNKEREAAYFERLCALGEPAMLLAKEQLEERSPRRALLAGRVLLAAGGPLERAWVRDRVRGDLQPKVAGPLLRELAELDPLLVDPGFLMQLLEHPQGSRREAAAELARQQLDESWLPLLVAAASSADSGLRLHGITLASKLTSPGARRLMLAALGDRRSAIALQAAMTLAHQPAGDTPELLRAVALGSAGWDQRAAYGLLALVQREINLGQSFLLEGDVPQLLSGLDSHQEIVAGAAAAALAGIGFRASADFETPWLSRRVPETLVRLCTGYVFHADLQALQRVGLPRLGLLSGESHGSQGVAWQAWWGATQGNFRPRRSALVPLANDELNLKLSLSSGHAGERETFFLHGPGIAAPTAEQAAPTYYLSHSQALELMAFIQENGLFEAARVPGSLGIGGLDRRSLMLGIGAGEKLFEGSMAEAPAWFCDAVEEVLSLRDGLRWQDWFDADQYASKFDFYAAEGPWWDAASGGEKQVRLKQMMLSSLAKLELPERTAGIQEFAQHVRQFDLLTSVDFVDLMGLLRDETDYGTRFSQAASSRARDLTRLALIAIGTPAGGLEAGPANQLLSHLTQAYGVAARLDLEQLLELAGGELLRTSAQASNPVLRMASARPLALLVQAKSKASGVQVPSSLELLTELLMASEELVASAAIEAVGSLELQVSKPHLLLRARDLPSNPITVRAAALRSLGSLGGEGVRELCVLALDEGSEFLAQAAVEGLANARDGRNAALLSALLARGSGSGFFDLAAAGLRQLGAEAVPDLLPQTLADDPRVRRQAAILLAQAGVPQAASELLMMLTEDPTDPLLAEELAILSAIDLRDSEQPIKGWWSWWDEVVHDDAGAWLRAAMLRQGFAAASSAEQASAGLEDLLGWASVKEPFLRERVRRELSWLLGRSIDPIPSDSAALAAWRAGLRASQQGEDGG